ncbi:hypothetical protein M3175_18070 [Robertmurraya korlensis]|uniref:hypothetical protein n=1 Tax=Robertmurraya korlensis TaxID=519977 RepID=UPI00203D00EF|nr:hypothetical protein [Robertmurraya korlensis]MCM3602644.1 hypothetical protein [Robertmurraya korlensis]
MQIKKNISSKRDNCKGIIIFSGYNQRAVISFIRTLEKNTIEYGIIAKSKEDPIFLTKYNKKVYSTRKSLALNLKDINYSIKEVQKKMHSSEYLIAPTSEALNRFLLTNQQNFNHLKCTIPLVDIELYEMISNKYSFGELCKTHGILTPKELDIFGEIAYPIVAKPKQYYTADTHEVFSPVIINNSKDLNFFESTHKSGEFYFQQFIHGKSYYLLYYFYRDGRVVKLSQENFIQQPMGKSMIAARTSSFHNGSESNKYEELLLQLNYYGLIMLEIKESQGEHYMIEANPRFWGPSQLFVDAGINFFEALLDDFGYITSGNSAQNNNREASYFWYGGMYETLRKNQQLTFHNYTASSLAQDLDAWIENDVYRREDTMAIFLKETGMHE